MGRRPIAIASRAEGVPDSGDTSEPADPGPGAGRGASSCMCFSGQLDRRRAVAPARARLVVNVFEFNAPGGGWRADLRRAPAATSILKCDKNF